MILESLQQLLVSILGHHYEIGSDTPPSYIPPFMIYGLNIVERYGHNGNWIRIEIKENIISINYHSWQFASVEKQEPIDIHHPQSIGAVIRRVSRLLGEPMPSFDEIDELLSRV